MTLLVVSENLSSGSGGKIFDLFKFGEFSFELLDFLVAVGQIPRGLPSSRLAWPVLPDDFVLKASSAATLVDDFVHFPFGHVDWRLDRLLLVG